MINQANHQVIQVVPLRINELSEKAIDQLYAILLHAYSTTEDVIWGPNYARISKEEFIQRIASNTGFGCTFKGEWVGSVFMYPRSSSILSFGILSASHLHSGNGIGKALISEVEDFAKMNGYSLIQIEVLRPANFDTPFKIWLGNWYQQLGYQKTDEMGFLDLETDQSDKAKRLITEVVFDRYEKSLN